MSNTISQINSPSNILTKIYIPLKKNTFPIMFLTKKEIKILLKKFKEEPFAKLIPRGLQYISDELDISKEDLEELINNEKDITKKIVLLSKLFDTDKDIYTARKLLLELDTYEDTIDISSLNNKEYYDLFKKQLSDLVNRNDEFDMDDTKKMEYLKSQIESNDNLLFFSSGNTPDRANLNFWVLPNRTYFPKFITETFENATKDHDRIPVKYYEYGNFSYIDPFIHQKFVSDYLSDNTPYRGLLLYHGLGSGKSGSSVLIAEGFKHKKVCILLPASLHSNYKNEILKFGEQSYKTNFYWVWVNLPMETVEDQNKTYSFLESKGLEPELADKIIIKKGKHKGLFMIDNSQEQPNYNSLPIRDKELLDKQIEEMFNYKYTILHYNAHSYCIRDIFNAYCKNFDEIKNILFGTPNKNKFSENDLIQLFNYIFNKENNIPNPLDDKLIIVDEIHNLISKMVSSSTFGKLLYELIMRAKNVKIVFLSGTIAINSAFEFAVMFNLLRGYINTYSIKLTKINGTFKEDEIKSLLSNFIYIDRIRIDSNNSLIEVSRTPYGFINKYDQNGLYQGVIKSIDGEITDEEFINLLLNQLSVKYQQYGQNELKTYSVFPDLLVAKRANGTWISKNKKLLDKVQDEFNNKYIDTGNYTIKKDVLFKNKIVGLVSFYNEISGIDAATGANYFPDKYDAPAEDTEVYMTNYQFLEYALKRRVEREKEEQNVKMMLYNQAAEINKMSLDNVNSYFRIFSRQTGIFVFPPEINRPVLKDFYNKVDSEKEAENSYETEDFIINDYNPDKEYEKAYKNAINLLNERHLTNNDSKYSLSTLSPKYTKMLENINKTQGLIFCYSQYKQVEGIETFGRVLSANGYSKLVIESNKKNKTANIVFDSKIKPGKRVRYYAGNDLWLTGLVTSVQDKEVFLDGIKRTFNINEVYPCVFAFWTGEEKEEQRAKLLEIFNNDNNMFGQQCLILLSTAAGAEGINLRFVRQVHIMEPYWNNVRITQVIGRARRIKSHIKLPEGQRNVTVYQYRIKLTKAQVNGSWVKEVPDKDIITYYEKLEKIIKENNQDKEQDETNQKENIKNVTENFLKYSKVISSEIAEKDEGLTSDEVLFNISTKKDSILNNFLKAIKETAIDCHFNYNANITSDETLKNMKCYTNILSSDKTYSYEYNDGNDDTIQKNATQTFKRLIEVIIPYANLGTIRGLTEINNDSFNINTDKFEDGHPIYDFYLSNGLYYKDTTKYNIIIGSYKNNLPVLLPEFVDSKLNDYLSIESCIKKLGRFPTEKGEARDNYITQLKECHKEADEYWTCVQCFSNIINDIEVCEQCNIPKSVSDAFFNKKNKSNKTEEVTEVKPTSPQPKKKKISFFKP